MRWLLLVWLLTGCTTMTVPELRASFHAANAVDVGTTLYGLDHGCREGGLFAGADKGTVVGLGLAASAGAELICGNAEQEEKICWVVFTWVKVFAGGWNLSQVSGC